ncbi:HTH_Tnp_Tc3_2 domain-containing protein [Trichonephila clavipes]|nr:HTH_Tnp_Tc3_2 domain-containing protein [Trichonephila clavipes]
MMPRVSSRNTYQPVSDFDKGRIVVGLLHRSVSARVGRDPMDVSRTWNQWAQGGNMEHRAGSQRPINTRSREDRHVTCMILTDRAATLRALSQELGSFAIQQSELSSETMLQLPLTLHHRQERFQWCDQPRRPNDETFFQMNQGFVHSIKPVTTVFDSIVVNTLLHSSSSAGGIQNIARPHVAGIVQTFLDTENARLLSWPLRSPDLTPIEQVASHHTLITNVDELWHRVEAAWAPISVHVMQSLFDSMPRRITADITAK